MRTSWRRFFRRVAAVFCVAGGGLWFSACAYAQSASDNASDPAYVDGWQETDNGGVGFTPWSFAGSEEATTHGVDSTSSFNNIGKAWSFQLHTQPQIIRAGRGFLPLQVGQTLTTVVDLPTEHRFFGGFGIRLNTGGANICYGGEPCLPGTMPVERLSVFNFNFTNGIEFPNEWGHIEIGSSLRHYTQNPAITSQNAPPDPNDPNLMNGGVGADLGLRIEVTLGPTAEKYSLKLTPLGAPSMVFMETGELAHAGAGAIDWIEFLYYDAVSDPASATDLYIRSIAIGSGSASTGDFDGNGRVDGVDFLTWQRNFGTMTGATPNQGDSNADGDVDAGDLTTWKNHFGAAIVVNAESVSEPAGWALIGIGHAALSGWILSAGKSGAASLAKCKLLR